MSLKCPECATLLKVDGVQVRNHDVFVSYSHKDKLIADRVCASLEQRRIRCWVAPRDIAPGSDWSSSIIDAIGESRVMVLIFSANSNVSQQVLREVERAVAKGVQVTPLRLEDVTPSKSLEYFLSSCHWLDVDSKQLDNHLTNLGNHVKLMLVDDAASQRIAGELEARETAAVSSGAAQAPGKSGAKLLFAVILAVMIVAIVVAMLLRDRRGGANSTPPIQALVVAKTDSPIATPSATPPTPTVNAPVTVDLLAAIDLDHDVSRGVWSRDTDGLTYERKVAADAAILRLPYYLPPEYDLLTDFTLKPASDTDDPAKTGIWEICAVGPVSFPFCLADNGNTEYHLGSPGTPMAGGTLTHKDNLLEIGKKHSLAIHVRSNHVSVELDGTTLIDRDTNFQDMGTFGGPYAIGLNVPGLICWPNMVFNRIQIFDLSGKGHLIGRWHPDPLNVPPDYSAHTNFESLVNTVAIAVQGVSWKNKVNGDPTTLTALGKSCDDYLYVCAPFSGLYRIPENTIAFHTVEIRPPNVDTRATWRLAVYVDGDEGFIGTCQPDRAMDITVPIRKGARTLEIRSDPMGGNLGKQCALVFPRFIKEP
jgi:hypothetical protein